MKKKTNKISVKVSLIYIFLAILNIAFFSIMIYENQMDLIKDNVKFQAGRKTSKLIASLKKAAIDMDSKIFKKDSKAEVIQEINSIVGKIIRNFVIFTESGKLLYKSKADIKLKNTHVVNGIKAVTNKDFVGQQFFSKIDASNYTISFYIPIRFPHLGDVILLFKYNMKQIDKSLKNLYTLITLLIIIIGLIHILFAIFLYRVVISPIKKLHTKSELIQKGDLNARVKIKQEDELGDLGQAFNSMADSIQEKITDLEERDKIMNFELNMAKSIQKIIYPREDKHDKFDFSVYHRPLAQVSGDYYDIFELDKDKYGFLIVDVSGHGVPAALITMMAKEIFSQFAPRYHDPALLFKHVNLEMAKHLKDYIAYFSAFYVIVQKNNLIHYCNGGHQKPFVVKHKTGEVIPITSQGYILGIMKQAKEEFETVKMQLEKGDKLILFTDGIIEAMNIEREQYGIKRLQKLIEENYTKPGSEIVNLSINSLKNYMDIEKIKDDVTLFAIELK